LTSTPTHSERERERQGHQQGTEDHHHRVERPDKEEAEKMKTEAEAHSEDDRRRMEEVEARNRWTDSLSVGEDAPRKPREDRGGGREEAEEAIEDAKKAINEGGVARLRSATENVERSLHKIAEELYKTSQAAGAAGRPVPRRAQVRRGSSAGSSGAQEKKPGDVIDAEYVDVDETKRRTEKVVSFQL